MLRVSGTAGETASFAAVQPGSEKSIAVQTDSDDNDWFRRAARDLLGSDPGLALHVLTGISASSGYRYANGHREVPGNIVRHLLRGQQGGQWLACLMDGCAEPWWIEMQRECRVGRAALREVG